MRSFHPLLAEQATERMFGHADFIGRNGRPPEDPRPPSEAAQTRRLLPDPTPEVDLYEPGRYEVHRHTRRRVIAPSLRPLVGLLLETDAVPVGGDHLPPIGSRVAALVRRAEPAAPAVAMVELPRRWHSLESARGFPHAHDGERNFRAGLVAGRTPSQKSARELDRMGPAAESRRRLPSVLIPPRRRKRPAPVRQSMRVVSKVGKPARCHNSAHRDRRLEGAADPPGHDGPTDGGAIGGRYRRRLLRVLEDGRDAGTLEGRTLAEPQARDLVQHRLQVPGSMVVAGAESRPRRRAVPREGVATAIVVRSGYLLRGYFKASEQVPPFPRIYVCTRVFSTTGGSHETQSPAGMSRGARP